MAPPVEDDRLTDLLALAERAMRERVSPKPHSSATCFQFRLTAAFCRGRACLYAISWRYLVWEFLERLHETENEVDVVYGEGRKPTKG